MRRASKPFQALGSTLPRSPSRQATIGFAQPVLDCAPVAGLGEQRRRVRRCRRDEFVAPLAGLPFLRGHFREVPGGGGIRLFARAVEPFPQRLGDARVLLVERLPLVAQFLDFGRELRRVQRRRRGGLGALAQLNACVLLPERFPALELRQLRNEPAHPLRRRLRQQAGIGLPGPDLVRGGAGGLQLAGGERLLGGVQQTVNLLPHRIRFLLRRVNLCEPALLDHDQRGFEAPRQRPAFEWPDSTPANVPADSRRRWTCRRQAARLRRPALRRRPAPGAPASTARSAVRASSSFACAARSSYLRRLFAQRAKLGAQTGERFRRRGWILHPDPLAQPALESCPRPLLLVLAIEARLQCLAGRIRSAQRGQRRRRCPAPANGD